MPRVRQPHDKEVEITFYGERRKGGVFVSMTLLNAAGIPGNNEHIGGGTLRLRKSKKKKRAARKTRT